MTYINRARTDPNAGFETNIKSLLDFQGPIFLVQKTEKRCCITPMRRLASASSKGVLKTSLAPQLSVPSASMACISFDFTVLLKLQYFAVFQQPK